MLIINLTIYQKGFVFLPPRESNSGANYSNPGHLATLFGAFTYYVREVRTSQGSQMLFLALGSIPEEVENNPYSDM